MSQAHEEGRKALSPGRAAAAPWTSCDGWLAPRLFTGVFPGALRLSSSCTLWCTATMYAAGDGTGTGHAREWRPHPSREAWPARAQRPRMPALPLLRLDEPESTTGVGASRAGRLMPNSGINKAQAPGSARLTPDYTFQENLREWDMGQADKKKSRRKAPCCHVAVLLLNVG